MGQIILHYGITVLGSYLIGAIPFSYILGRVFAGIDIRKMGSGNPGATNLYRHAGPILGVPALLLDAAKGVVPVVLFSHLFGEPYLAYIAAACAVIGHMYTVFLGFKGGKGVATAAGVMIAVSWQLVLVALAVFVVTVAIFRYISLGSIMAATSIIVGSILFVIFGFGGYDWIFPVFCGIFGVLIITAHRKNIKRIITGEESKFSFKKKT